MSNNCVQQQLDGCSLTRPYFSVRGVACKTKESFHESKASENTALVPLHIHNKISLTSLWCGVEDSLYMSSIVAL